MPSLLSFLALFVLLMTTNLVSAHEYSSIDTACTRTYTVQADDTCDIIGQKTLTSTYQILAFNLPQAGASCYSLENGAELCLGRYGNDCQLVHRAISTDTCYAIASQFGISLELLQDNNPSLNCDQVYDGLNLCVAPAVVRPPPVDALNASIQAQKASGGNAKRALEYLEEMRKRELQQEDDDEL